MLEELRLLEEGGGSPDFDAQLEELNARIDAVQPNSGTAAASAALETAAAEASASSTDGAEEKATLPRWPAPVKPRAIARARGRPPNSEEPEALQVEQLSLEESWRDSFAAHQCRPSDAAASPPRIAVQEQLPCTELADQTLEDMLELAEFASVVWPPGLDARIARQILSARRLLSA